MMRTRITLAILALLLAPSIKIQNAQAVDSRAIIDNEFDKMSGKRGQKIDLECTFEENRIPQRLQGTYSTTSEYEDEGVGTETVATTDKDLPPPMKVTFKRRRNLSKTNDKLYVYAKDKTGRQTIYQIDQSLRLLAVYQQNPMTDPLPFTEMYAGTCAGIF